MDAESVHKVAVVGAGTMGPGLALVFARAGHSVSLYSRTEGTLEKALSVAAADLGTLVRHDLLEARGRTGDARPHHAHDVAGAGGRRSGPRRRGRR